MYQEFESELNTTGGVTFDLLVMKSKVTYYTECLEKIKDSKEYLQLVNNEDENIAKLDEIEERVCNVFINWIKRLSERILTLKSNKDLNTARGKWDNNSGIGGWTGPFLKPLYTQTMETDEDVKKFLEIENHLKTITVVEVNGKKTSIWPVLIGLAVGLFATYWMFKLVF
jgi:hypothetical protein